MNFHSCVWPASQIFRRVAPPRDSREIMEYPQGPPGRRPELQMRSGLRRCSSPKFAHTRRECFNGAAARSSSLDGHFRVMRVGLNPIVLRTCFVSSVPFTTSRRIARRARRSANAAEATATTIFIPVFCMEPSMLGGYHTLATNARRSEDPRSSCRCIEVYISKFRNIVEAELPIGAANLRGRLPSRHGAGS